MVLSMTLLSHVVQRKGDAAAVGAVDAVPLRTHERSDRCVDRDDDYQQDAKEGGNVTSIRVSLGKPKKHNGAPDNQRPVHANV